MSSWNRWFWLFLVFNNFFFFFSALFLFSFFFWSAWDTGFHWATINSFDFLFLFLFLLYFPAVFLFSHTQKRLKHTHTHTRRVSLSLSLFFLEFPFCSLVFLWSSFFTTSLYYNENNLYLDFLFIHCGWAHCVVPCTNLSLSMWIFRGVVVNIHEFLRLLFF